MAAREKPLFVPLKREYFLQFKAGIKHLNEEYRAYGPRWNENTCWPGRPAVLSLGYGKQNRLHTHVVGFRRIRPSDLPPEVEQSLLALYGDEDIAAIQMAPCSE